MFGDPIARAMEDWHREHAGRHDDPEWGLFVADLLELVRAKADELLEEHTNEGLFGMSKAGGCTRAVALKSIGYEPEPLSGSTRVTFLIGHLVEGIAIATLRRLGYEVQSHDPDGGQIRARRWPFSSATDGIIADLRGRPASLSVKSTGYKKSGFERKGAEGRWVRRGFPELPFHGVLGAQPGHWAQMQAEMWALGLEQALYVVVAKDIIKSMEGDPYLGPEGNGSLCFYAEVVPFNPEFVEQQLLPTWERTMAAVTEGRAGPAYYITSAGMYTEIAPAATGRVPNAERTGTFNPCDYCDIIAGCRDAIRRHR